MTVLRRLIDPTDSTRRLSRVCGDKSHRCPGWAGGGLRYARQVRCANGRIKVRPLTRREKQRHERDQRLLAEWEANSDTDVNPVFFQDGFFNDHPSAHPFRFGHCTVCGVITWPVATQRLDLTLLLARARWAARRARWEMENRKRDREGSAS